MSMELKAGWQELKVRQEFHFSRWHVFWRYVIRHEPMNFVLSAQLYAPEKSKGEIAMLIAEETISEDAGWREIS